MASKFKCGTWGAALSVASACTAAASSVDVTIHWTSHGVPHVKAADYRSLGYGYGYAIAGDRLCLLADHIITLRGERSRWYGPAEGAVVGFVPVTNLDSDLFYRVQLSDDTVKAATVHVTKKARDLAQGYAAGFNRYLRDQKAGAAQSLCKGAPLPQMIEADVVRAMMSIGTIWKAFHIAPFAKASVWGTEPSQPSASSGPAQRALPESIGSNAWAYGGDVTRTGSSIVVANPHTVWRGHWLSLHQLHLTIPGEIDAAGADFLGLPMPVIGFNRDVAWSIEAPVTVTYFVLQALKVDEGKDPTYAVDAKTRPLTIKTVSLEIKQAKGAIKKESFPVAYSRLGPLYRLPAQPGRTAGWYAITDAGDGNAKGLDQLLDAARATNIASFRKAMESNRGIGAHFIAGDRFGDALYIESGPLLDIDDAALASCRLAGEEVEFNVLDGSRGACAVRTATGLPKLLPVDRFPTLVTRGIVQNANDSYRFAVHGRHVTGYSRLLGDPQAGLDDLRTPMSEKRMIELTADGKVTSDETLQVVLDNRNYAAESWLDAIVATCSRAGVAPEAARGCAILANWDRKNDANSRGPLLFSQLWQRMQSVPQLFAEPFDIERPFQVRPLASTDAVQSGIVAALTESVKALEALQLTGDEPWGQLLAARTPNEKVPLHGGPAEEGVLNALRGVGLGKDGFAGIASGTDYLQRVWWEAEAVIADGLLAHGQSDDPASPQSFDQLALFSTKQLSKLPFTDAQIAADPQLKTLRLRD